MLFKPVCGLIAKTATEWMSKVLCRSDVLVRRALAESTKIKDRNVDGFGIMPMINFLKMANDVAAWYRCSSHVAET